MEYDTTSPNKDRAVLVWQHRVGSKQKKILVSKRIFACIERTSKTEVLQTPSAIEVNLGQGVK